jgi:hypothetical protein
LRQQIWVFCHFPFHAAVLLTAEGVSQFSVWRKIVDLTIPFVKAMKYYPSSLHGSSLASYFKETLEALYRKIPESTAEHADLTPYFEVFANPDNSIETKLEAGYKITAAGVVFVCKTFVVELPGPTPPKGETDPSQLFIRIYDTYAVIYIYFFTSAGLLLIFLALLFIPRQTPQSTWGLPINRPKYSCRYWTRSSSAYVFVCRQHSEHVWQLYL